MLDSQKTIRRIGPYSRPVALAKLDGRTREARVLQHARAELVSHVGGCPSATQNVLIDRAAQLSLQLALMEEKQAKGGITERDSKVYLAWSGALVRLMRQLGLRGAAERPMTLQDHVARRVAERTAA